jgi:hypothetical protein
LWQIETAAYVTARLSEVHRFHLNKEKNHAKFNKGFHVLDISDGKMKPAIGYSLSHLDGTYHIKRRIITERVEGLPRRKLWFYGVLLYEVLVGERPF